MATALAPVVMAAMSAMSAMVATPAMGAVTVARAMVTVFPRQAAVAGGFVRNCYGDKDDVRAGR